MDMKERKTMVYCMEFIARNFNDEEDLFRWLMLGVADGDFNYQDMISHPDECMNSVDDYYIEDETFADLMNVFLMCAKSAAKDGGLYCDGIVDKADV